MRCEGDCWRSVHSDSKMERLWRLTWGLVLVIGLTAVSELFPRLGDSKPQPDMPPVVSAHVVHSVK